MCVCVRARVVCMYTSCVCEREVLLLRDAYEYECRVQLAEIRMHCMHACMYVCACVSLCECVYIYIYVYIHTHIYIYVYVRTHVCVYVCLYVYIYIYIYIYIYTIASGLEQIARI